MNNSSIGKKIRQAREGRGWRQEEFAEKIGLSVTYTGMIERGEKVPKLETFIRIANVLEVSADQLLSDVLKVGYNIKASILSEKIEKLSLQEREQIYRVLDAMLNTDN